MAGARSAVKATLDRFPRLYHAAAFGQSIARWLTRRVHDRDYRAAAGAGLIVDIGANRGQSALSFAVVAPEARIVSFEPHPGHRRDLGWVSKLLRGRLTIHEVALGETDGTAVLWVPTSGHREITGESSLDEGALTRARRRVKVDGHREVSVPVRTLDSYNLAPDIIKVDVQGTEASVLAGAVSTLARARPLVLVEAGVTDDAVAGVLEPLGYHRTGGPRNWLWSPDPKAA
jgi:FkbM family methyltransferase